MTTLLSLRPDVQYALDVVSSGRQLTIQVESDYRQSPPQAHVNLIAYEQRPLVAASGFSFPLETQSALDLTIYQLVQGPITDEERSHKHLFHKLEHALKGSPASVEAATQLLATAKKIQEHLDEGLRLVAESESQCRQSIRHRFACSAKALCERTCEAWNGLVAGLHHSVSAHADSSQSIMKSMHDHHQCGDEKLAAFLNETIDAQFEATLKAVDVEEQTNVLVQALEWLACTIGLSALYAFIRRRFTSLRTRVERLADREERRVARQYECAARREAMRRRWQRVKDVFSRSRLNDEDEEKRALVLEAALPAESDGCAGPSSSSPDMVQGRPSLSYAQDIAVMIMRGATRPRQSSDARSRSSTLPSYMSEQLPEYSYKQEYDAEHVVDGFRSASPSIISVTTTVQTPDTSLPTLSPRCSQETLRTGSGN